MKTMSPSDAKAQAEATGRSIKYLHDGRKCIALAGPNAPVREDWHGRSTARRVAAEMVELMRHHAARDEVHAEAKRISQRALNYGYPQPSIYAGAAR